jgi:dCTP deaminase
MAVLAKDEIETRRRDTMERRLVITPLLDAERQIQAASVDLRLGSDFFLLTRTSVEAVEPPSHEFHSQIRRVSHRIHVPLGDFIVLHPKQFVLGATLEFLRFPRDLMAYVEGRSSWGRLGLVIATATVVSPGYAGTLTFEIANVGEVPFGCIRGPELRSL